jgi:TrmH family RNA methyltransferase
VNQQDFGAELITSRRNPLVKRLRELHGAKGRREQGRLLLEGTHLLQEVLRLGLIPAELVATERWLEGHGALVAALPVGVRGHRVSELVLEAAASTAHPDGVLLTLELGALVVPEAALPTFVLVLDGVQDPGNLGTLIRTALAAGVEQLWLAEGADPFQPKVLRASAGAALALPIRRLERLALLQLLAEAAARGLQLAAAVPPGSGDGSGPGDGSRASSSIPYWQLDWRKPTALLLGHEGSGLAPEVLALASHRITVPHSPAVESLNVAVSAAPLLLERVRQASQHR